MPIKLVAVDLDDTLLNSKIAIGPRSLVAIREAMAQGVVVTIATGRMYRSTLPFARQLELDVPLITYNGALVKASLSGTTYLHRPLDLAVAREVLALFKDRGWHIQAFVDDVLYVAEINDKVLSYQRVAKVEPVVIGKDLYRLTAPPTKLLAIADPAEIKAIYKEVHATFGDRLFLTASKRYFLEMINPDVNKGKALAFLAAQLGIKREEVMAVGDSYNDLEMIEYAGLGVAMGNAPDEVKARAKAVTCSNDEDGVAEAIWRYVLGKEHKPGNTINFN